MSYKIYIIYHFDNFKPVEDLIIAVNNYNNSKKINDRDIDMFYFKKNGNIISSSDGIIYEINDESWKEKATKKIDDANLICFIMSSNTSIDFYSNVFFEYNYAVKRNKRIVLLKGDDKSLEPNIIEQFFKDEIYGKVIDKRAEFEPDEIIKYAKFKVKDSLLIEDSKDMEKSERELYYNLLLEQYKIMINTSEALIDRRQAMSNLYTGICTTLVSLIGASFALKEFYAIAAVFFFVGIVILIICYTWRVQLESYNKTNYGKYEVINAIEEKLPANMFDVEYKFNVNHGIKTYSKREKLLPMIFGIVGIIFLFFAITILIIGFVL